MNYLHGKAFRDDASSSSNLVWASTQGRNEVDHERITHLRLAAAVAFDHGIAASIMGKSMIHRVSKFILANVVLWTFTRAYFDVMGIPITVI